MTKAVREGFTVDELRSFGVKCGQVIEVAELCGGLVCAVSIVEREAAAKTDIL